MGWQDRYHDICDTGAESDDELLAVLTRARALLAGGVLPALAQGERWAIVGNLDAAIGRGLDATELGEAMAASGMTAEEIGRALVPSEPRRSCGACGGAGIVQTAWPPFDEPCPACRPRNK